MNLRYNSCQMVHHHDQENHDSRCGLRGHSQRVYQTRRHDDSAVVVQYQEVQDKTSIGGNDYDLEVSIEKRVSAVP